MGPMGSNQRPMITLSGLSTLKGREGRGDAGDPGDSCEMILPRSPPRRSVHVCVLMRKYTRVIEMYLNATEASAADVGVKN